MTVKGLLCKDLSGIFVPLLVFTAMLLAGAAKKIPYFLAFSALMIEMLPIDGMPKDAVSRWESYQLTMPVSRFGIVTEKYLLMLFCTAASAVLLSIGMLRFLLQGEMFVSDYTLWIVRACMGGILIPAVYFPFCFRFGYGKGKAVYILLIVSFAVLITGELAVTEAAEAHGLLSAKVLHGCFPLLTGNTAVSRLLCMLLDADSSQIIAVSVSGALILTLLSWLLSLWGFRRREF